MIKQLLLFSLVCFVIVQIYNRATDGFSIAQMRSSHPLNSRFDPPPPFLGSLDGSFHYLGKGCQFYAFGNEEYVLKFLKQKHLRPSSPIFKQSVERRKARVERLFSSVQLSFEKMPEESGLLYIHLNRVPALKRKVTLVDKVGLRHKVNLDDYEFVIQKRARTAKEVFAEASEAEARERIEQLVALVYERCAKGIRDRDRSFVQNIAFSKERALYIDVGQMYEDETILDAEEQRLDLQRRMGNLRFWMEKHHPEFNHLID